MERVYLDSVGMIYLVEQRLPWFPVVHNRLQSASVVASDLTRMECMVKPLRLGLSALVAEFEIMFSGVEVVPLTTPVFERATAIRAKFGYKTPDALHLAAAIEFNCDVFLTNDHRLSTSTGIRVEVI